LANRQRLHILEYLATRPQATVSEVAQSVGLPDAVASQYLRALNARGLLRAQRSGRWVYYRMAPDPVVPEAESLVSALQDSFGCGSLDAKTVFAVLTAFTHPRRVTIVRLLHRLGVLEFNPLRLRSDMSRQALGRHLRKLMDRGIVEEGTDGYRLCRPRNKLTKVLIGIAAHK